MTAMNFLQLNDLIPDKASSVSFLQQRGILPNPRHCTAGHQMTLDLREKGDRWRCRSRGCREEFSLRAGTWLEGSKMSYRQIILHLYGWCYEYTSVKFSSHELNFGKNAIIDYNNYCREICAMSLLANPMVIGGPGKTVEIDESLYVKRKYNRGRQFREQWVFGGICREDRQSFLYPVEARDAATLLPTIRDSVRPGTTILSDMWAAYNQIQQDGYQHGTVNHSLNFVDPVTGVHTNTIECHWKHAKQRHKRHNGTHRSMLDSYMCEWMWRQRNKFHPCIFSKLLEDMAFHFPPPH